MTLFKGLFDHLGNSSATVQTPNGSVSPLPLATRLWHFGGGFDWGRLTDEARNLALAVLHKATGADNLSLYFVESFAKEVIAMLPPGPWELAETAVLKWLTNKVEQDLFPSTAFANTPVEAQGGDGANG